MNVPDETRNNNINTDLPPTIVNNIRFPIIIIYYLLVHHSSVVDGSVDETKKRKKKKKMKDTNLTHKIVVLCVDNKII